MSLLVSCITLLLTSILNCGFENVVFQALSPEYHCRLRAIASTVFGRRQPPHIVVSISPPYWGRCLGRDTLPWSLG